MWGWGARDNIAQGVAMPLHARAVAIAAERNESPLVVVSVELAMVSEALRSASIERLRSGGVDIDEQRFAMVATHTHSGPAGFSTYLWYALAGPGFSPTLLGRLADGVALAVRQAIASLEPGRVRMAAGDIALSEPVSVNRSIKAYNRNPEVSPVPIDRADEAVSRRMTVLRFERENGQARGLLAVFPVHGTCVHADNQLLHPDNMGVAAQALEAHAAREGERDFVAVFAQESAGDVSPNYRYCKRRGLMIGRYDDDFESAAWNGGILARAAAQLLESASSAPALEARLSGALHYRAVDEHAADADLLPAGMSRDRAGAAELGFDFALGTAEGPGPFALLPSLAARALQQAIARFSADPDPRQQPKIGMFRLGNGVQDRVAGRLAWRQLAKLLKADRRMSYYLAAMDGPATSQLPWVPHVLPFQVLCIGEFAAGLVPFEPTTVAGQRLRRGLASTLGPGSSPVVIGYANAYASYLCTPEEYDEQGYEGASTLFGRASLPVVATLLRGVARQLAHRTGGSLADARSNRPAEPQLPHVDGFFGRARAGLERFDATGRFRPPPRSALSIGGRR